MTLRPARALTLLLLSSFIALNRADAACLAPENLKRMELEIISCGPYLARVLGDRVTEHYKDVTRGAREGPDIERMLEAEPVVEIRARVIRTRELPGIANGRRMGDWEEPADHPVVQYYFFTSGGCDALPAGGRVIADENAPCCDTLPHRSLTCFTGEAHLVPAR